MLQHVHADHISQHWDYIRNGLERILDRAADRWRPEDVYMQLKLGNCGLWLVMEPDLCGFVVLQPRPGWDGIEVNVFAAYRENGDAMDNIEDVKQIARGFNAKRLVFQSKRRGWDRRAEQMGYTLDHVAWGMEL